MEAVSVAVIKCSHTLAPDLFWPSPETPCTLPIVFVVHQPPTSTPPPCRLPSCACCGPSILCRALRSPTGAPGLASYLPANHLSPPCPLQTPPMRMLTDEEVATHLWNGATSVARRAVRVSGGQVWGEALSGTGEATSAGDGGPVARGVACAFRAGRCG